MYKRIFLLIMLIFALFTPFTKLEAKSIVDFEVSGPMGDNMKLYRDNYHLDIEETSILEKGNDIINQIANMLFSIITTIGYLVIAVFHHAMDFDIANLLSGQIDGIQTALIDGVFFPILGLAIAFSCYTVIKFLLQRNFAGILSHFTKVIIIILLSYLIKEHSATIITGATELTKSLSGEIAKSLNDTGTDENDSFASTASVMLWENLIHIPYSSLQIGETATDDGIVQELLKMTAGSEDRQNRVDEYAKENKGVFSKNAGGKRIAFTLVYLIPFIIKCFIYGASALLQIAMQVMAIFIILLAPIILILSLFDVFGGFKIVETWIKKLVETQIAVLIINLLLSLLVKIDIALFALVPTFGFLVILTFQTAICVVIFLQRDSLLKTVTSTARVAGNPSLALAKLRNLDTGKAIAGAKNAIGQGAQSASNLINDTAMRNQSYNTNKSLTHGEIEEKEEKKVSSYIEPINNEKVINMQSIIDAKESRINRDMETANNDNKKSELRTTDMLDDEEIKENTINDDTAVNRPDTNDYYKIKQAQDDNLTTTQAQNSNVIPIQAPVTQAPQETVPILTTNAQDSEHVAQYSEPFSMEAHTNETAINSGKADISSFRKSNNDNIANIDTGLQNRAFDENLQNNNNEISHANISNMKPTLENESKETGLADMDSIENQNAINNAHDTDASDKSNVLVTNIENVENISNLSESTENISNESTEIKDELQTSNQIVPTMQDITVNTIENQPQQTKEQAPQEIKVSLEEVKHDINVKVDELKQQEIKINLDDIKSSNDFLSAEPNKSSSLDLDIKNILADIGAKNQSQGAEKIVAEEIVIENNIVEKTIINDSNLNDEELTDDELDAEMYGTDYTDED